MTVILDLEPDMEARLRTRALQQGQNVDTFLRGIAEREALAVPPQLSDEEFERLSDELADIVGPDVPNWSNDDISREVIYGERG